MGNENSQKIQQPKQQEAPSSPKKLKNNISKSPAKSSNKQMRVQQKLSIIIPTIVSKQVNQQIVNPISPELWQKIEPIMRISLNNFRNIFLLKIVKNQIRLIFQDQSQQFQNSSHISHYSQHSLAILQKKSSNDLKVYEQISKTRMKSYINSQSPKNTSEAIKNFDRIREILQSKLNQINNELIGQIQGKTSIWHSLNLSQQSKTNNIIAFLHQEGIQYTTIDFLKTKKQRIGIPL